MFERARLKVICTAQGAIRIEGPRAVPDFSRSRTDMTALYIGILFGG